MDPHHPKYGNVDPAMTRSNKKIHRSASINAMIILGDSYRLQCYYSYCSKARKFHLMAEKITTNCTICSWKFYLEFFSPVIANKYIESVAKS